MRTKSHRGRQLKSAVLAGHAPCLYNIVVHLLLDFCHTTTLSLSLSLAKTSVFLGKNKHIEPAYISWVKSVFVVIFSPAFSGKFWCFLGPSHPWTPWLRLRPMLPPPSCERSGCQPPAGGTATKNQDAPRGNMGKKATNHGILIDFTGFYWMLMDFNGFYWIFVNVGVHITPIGVGFHGRYLELINEGNKKR